MTHGFFPAGVGKRSAWWRACCRGGEAKQIFTDPVTLTHGFCCGGRCREPAAGAANRNKYLRDPLTLTHGFFRQGSGNGVPGGEPAAGAANRNKYIYGSADIDTRFFSCRGRETECLVASLLPGRPYLFQVRAYNRAGVGPWSSPLEVISGTVPSRYLHTVLFGSDL